MQSRSYKGVELSIVLLLLLMHLGMAIECYECVHNSQKVKRRHRYVFPCSEFDGSERFIVRCPDSQFCVYQSISLALARDTITVRTMDGCTPNATDKTRITEAWLAADGCTSVGDFFSPSSVSYCFCGHNYCNDAPRIHAKGYHFYPCLYMALILLFGQTFMNQR